MAPPRHAASLAPDYGRRRPRRLRASGRPRLAPAARYASRARCSGGAPWRYSPSTELEGAEGQGSGVGQANSFPKFHRAVPPTFRRGRGGPHLSPSGGSTSSTRATTPASLLFPLRARCLTRILEIRGAITRPPGLTLQRRPAQLGGGTEGNVQVGLADIRAGRDVAGLAPGRAADGLERGVRVVSHIGDDIVGQARRREVTAAVGKAQVRSGTH
jgi:hypothetical protein